jgi:hypothetical protein
MKLLPFLFVISFDKHPPLPVSKKKTVENMHISPWAGEMPDKTEKSKNQYGELMVKSVNKTCV